LGTFMEVTVWNEPCPSQFHYQREFWSKYTEMRKLHILSNVTLPDKEQWRELENDAPDHTHTFCFVELREDAKVQDRDFVAGKRLIVRYVHVADLVEQGKAILV